MKGVQALLKISGDAINSCGAWGVIQFPNTDTTTVFNYLKVTVFTYHPVLFERLSGVQLTFINSGKGL